jgi:hypothetical protein
MTGTKQKNQLAKQKTQKNPPSKNKEKGESIFAWCTSIGPGALAKQKKQKKSKPPKKGF